MIELTPCARFLLMMSYLVYLQEIGHISEATNLISELLSRYTKEEMELGLDVLKEHAYKITPEGLAEVKEILGR